MGDLNVDYLKQGNEPIKQSFQLNGFSQLIKSPTETTATVIDVIQMNKECNISYNVVIPADLNDHNLIGCVRNMHNIKCQQKAIRCRNTLVILVLHCYPTSLSLSIFNWSCLCEYGGEEGCVTLCSDIDIFYFESYGKAEMFNSTRSY